MKKFLIYSANRIQKLLLLLLLMHNKLFSKNENTVIITLAGGLGNQLFQYAFAKLLEKQLCKNVMLDGCYRYGLDRYKRTYSLSNFQITLINKKHRFSNPIFLHNINEKRRGYYKLLRFLAPNYINQEDKKDNIVSCLKEFKATDLIYAEGYWQSAEAVNLCRQELLADIKLAHKASNEYYELSKEISGHKNSAAIHFRQSWNVGNSTIGQKHTQNTLSLEYYKRAINLVRKNKKGTMFFIFADNTDKAEMMIAKILSKSDYHIIHRRNDKNNDCEDLLLISQCQHHIMSNSTFSWWGTWLSWAKIPPEENKNIYIMTCDWNADGMKTSVTKELTFSPNIIHL